MAVAFVLEKHPCVRVRQIGVEHEVLDRDRHVDLRLRETLLDEQQQPLRSLLITDTVGFIRALPPQLVEAFRSTIEEALDADGLLLVVDLADPAWPEQLRTVRGILADLGSREPQLVIGNQIDRCPAGELERARCLEPAMLFVSATADLGLRSLRQRLLEWPPPRPQGDELSIVAGSAG